MTVSPEASVLSVAGITPALDESAFVAAGARIVGAVRLEAGASVWYNAILRGDRDSITIGGGSNIQDNVSVHVDRGHPVTIGRDVSVGHNAVVHAFRFEGKRERQRYLQLDDAKRQELLSLPHCGRHSLGDPRLIRLVDL